MQAHTRPTPSPILTGSTAAEAASTTGIMARLATALRTANEMVGLSMIPFGRSIRRADHHEQLRPDGDDRSADRTVVEQHASSTGWRRG